MTTTSPFGGFDGPGPAGPSSPSGPAQPATVPAPTWRDLPTHPPYGPVPPPRTANITAGFSAPAVPGSSTFSPRQIALAVGGTLLLVAIGITAALLVLDDDEDALAQDTPAVVDEPDQPGPGTQVPDPEDPPRGELQPQQPPVAPDAPDDPAPEGGTTPEGMPPPQVAPPDGGSSPGQGQEPTAQSDEDDVLPRLFVLRTLPSGMQESSTTVRHTTRDDEVVLEQTTLLELLDPPGDEDEVTVRATRDADAADRLAGMVTDDAEELSVRGLPAHLVDEGRLVWLVPGDDVTGGLDTLIEIVAPPEVRTDELLTIGNGLELIR